MTITKVTTDVITALAVTAPKLAANAVTTDKLADNAVTAAKIAAGALGDQVAGITSSASATTIAGTLTIPSDIIHSGDTDTILQFNANDSWRVITGDEERFKVNNGEVVVNDNSVDMDFRVESNGNANMLFVDGGNNKIGIATASPISPLHVKEQHAGLSHGYVYADNGISVESDEPMIQLMATDGGTHGGSLLWRYGANVFAAVANPTTDNLDFIYGVTSADDFDVHAGTNMTSHRRSMSIGADGNVGIGAIPKTTEAGWTNLSVGGQGALINSTSANAGGRTQLSNNVYVDESGNYSYISTDQASLYKQIDGIHSWHSAGSGSADAHITMSERMRIHGNGKAAWAANGIGSTATVARDFAFYTEGSTNGVEVRSNDQRLVFMGAGGSSGTGVDDGYLAMSSQGTGKIAFNTNGVSYFNGGKLGIGETDPNEPLTIRSSAENVNTVLMEIGNDLHASNTKDAWIKYVGGAAQTDHSWAAGIYSNTFKIVQLGARATAPLSGTDRLTLDATGTMQLHSNGSGDTTIKFYEGSTIKWWVQNDTAGSPGSDAFWIGDEENDNGVYVQQDGASWSGISDERLKRNWTNLTNATDKIDTLTKVGTFQRRGKSTGKWSDNREVGLSAQEVEAILPEVVTTGGNIEFASDDKVAGVKGMSYEKLVPLLVKSIQELNARIKTLEG